ncbi:hypothetical protein BJY14_003586 [Actinomadura luteofluorescens]|uniref:Uncharacterized protein n=1 Tax=Actinomadura luteofluorescens TaxID=46163 RepID=A0A7Y9JGG7_9ACTN|nr:hypothetical protein [Actinomadura luteofluorescens]NYD47603.1 hypothetical protein [Actinomadura luteofluorescens]
MTSTAPEPHDLARLTRPLRRLPELASPAAYRQLRAAFKKHEMSDAAASALSTIWVDPEAVVPQVAHPQRRRVPGGYLLVITGRVWSGRITPDTENPRNADHVQFAIAETLGISPVGLPSARVHGVGEMAIRAKSRTALGEQLEWTVETTRSRNEPHPSIAEQGIMDPPIGVATTVIYEDPDEAPTTHVFVREGSSRVSHAHYHLGLTAEDALFGLPRNAAAMQQHVDEINGFAGKDAAEIEESEKAAIRCAITEFELVIGVEEDAPDSTDLAEAIKARVAQDHLNPKKKWTESSRLTSLAEECLGALRKAGAIRSDAEADWLGGRLTRAEAIAHKIPAHGDHRAARLVHLFTTNDPQAHNAIRNPIALVLLDEADGSAKRNRQVRGNTKLPLGVELVVRELLGVAPDRAVAGFRKTFIDALPTNLSTRTWKPSRRSPEALYAAAAQELAEDQVGGSAGTELWVRAAYVLAKHNKIGGGRHDMGDGGDRRTSRELMEDLLGLDLGLRQLRQAVEDDRDGRAPRLIDAQGLPRQDATGEEIPITNERLRVKIAPKDTSNTGPSNGDAQTRFRHKVKVMRDSLRNMESSMRDVEGIVDSGGDRLIETTGREAALLMSKQLYKLFERANAWYGAAFDGQTNPFADDEPENQDPA